MKKSTWILIISGVLVSGAALAGGASINIKIDASGIKTKKQNEQKAEEAAPAAAAVEVAPPPPPPPPRPDPLPEDWAGGGKTVAEAMGGALVTEGSYDDTLKLTVNAKAGQCYSLFINADSKPSAQQDFKWTSTRSIQRYGIGLNTRAFRVEGFCALSDGAVTGAMVAEVPGTAKTSYAVVSWPKAELPNHQISGLWVFGDHCDLPAWRALWLDPIPGTIVYGNNEPMLISYFPDRGRIDYEDASGTRRMFHTSQGAPKLTNELTGPPAWDLKTEGNLCNCKKILDRGLGSAVDDAYSASLHADSPEARATAKARYTQLLARYNSEIQSSGCLAKINDADKNFPALLDKIVDTYNSNPPKSTVDRVTMLASYPQK